VVYLRVEILCLFKELKEKFFVMAHKGIERLAAPG
jgi:hypothetical protein